MPGLGTASQRPSAPSSPVLMNACAVPRLRTAARVGAYSVRFANATWDAPINVLTDALQVGGP